MPKGTIANAPNVMPGAKGFIEATTPVIRRSHSNRTAGSSPHDMDRIGAHALTGLNLKHDRGKGGVTEERRPRTESDGGNRDIDDINCVEGEELAGDISTAA